MRRLERLARWSGHPFRDASFLPAIELGTNIAELARHQVWRQVYLSRYARLSVTEQEGMTAQRLAAYVRETSAILKGEAPLSSEAETNFM